MRLKLWRVTHFICSLTLLVLICNVSSVFAGSKLNVVATTSMIADAVKQVGGKHVRVTALMGAGVDPHAYRQTRTDLVKLTRADLIFRHGLYLEAQMEEFFKELSRRKEVVTVGRGVSKSSLLDHDDYDNQFDPHVWMDPKLWLEVVKSVKAALIKKDPDNRKSYTHNVQVYETQIQKLSFYSQKVLGSVPENKRILLTAHDAFNYFGKAYGFEVMGIQGISTESEAGLKRIEDLVKLLVNKRISAVFVETSVADRNVKAIIEGASARGHKVVIGGELFSDAMGKENTYEGTYVGMIDHNVTIISRALGGNAPVKGMQGKLSAGGQRE